MKDFLEEPGNDSSRLVIKNASYLRPFGLKSMRHRGIGVNFLSKSGTTSNTGLWPAVFNVATKSVISVNATCGEGGREEYCRMSESSKGRCYVCDNFSPDPTKQHPIHHAIDGTGKWWQSPALYRGREYDGDSVPCCEVLAPYSDSESTYGVRLTKNRVSRQDPLSHRIIEKRRRDRMNNCLADLSRLIPAEYLKKGRGRVEKTEIIEIDVY
ncbi:Laminin N-terminal (Domain VI) [Popillia japonica]|uniref:Laminin N-terminal (Domain VI) n=1 Tax=Popillia japonica TaxID=7064 RepID=A0AAW1K2N0_POPJA